MNKCASAVVNPVVGHLDRAGKVALGDQVDRRCRVWFPTAYFGLDAATAIVVFTFF